jgi:hypothetical protein
MANIDNGLHSQTFSGWEWDLNNYTASTKTAGDDVDRAWRELGAYRKSAGVHLFLL